VQELVQGRLDRCVWRHSFHRITMPIFVCDVNVAFRKKLVPRTRRIVTFIGPEGLENVLKPVECSSENGPFWELVEKWCCGNTHMDEQGVRLQSWLPF
jgi:hypothetical protein